MALIRTQRDLGRRGSLWRTSFFHCRQLLEEGVPELVKLFIFEQLVTHVLKLLDIFVLCDFPEAVLKAVKFALDVIYYFLLHLFVFVQLNGL